MSIYEQIKEIPITDIAESLGIEARGTGNTKQAYCYNGHDKKTKSLSLNTARNFYNCFGCNEGGDGLELVKNCLKLSKADAIKWTKEKFNITDDGERKPILKSGKAQKNITEYFDTLDKWDTEKTAGIYRAFIDSLPLVSEGSYLIAERGLSKGVLDANDIRHIPQGYNIKALGFTEQDLRDSGLLAEGGFTLYNCDYVFPFYRGDKIVYLQGVFKEREKKYKNLTGRAKPLLFLPKAFKGYEGEVYITEGIIDALSGLEAGLNAVAILDANITENTGKLGELEALKHLTCVICGDNDITGVKAERVLYGYMLKHFFTVKHLDIDELRREYRIEERIKDFNDLVRAIKRKVGVL